MKTIQDETLIVIPYVSSGQGKELELSLTGWKKFFTSPHRIIVIGDYNECIEKLGAEYLNMERSPFLSDQYNPNIDVARKLDKIYDLYHNEYDHFVLANDDEYPIHEFDYTFLMKTWWLQDKFQGNSAAPTNYWSHDMYKTRKALDDSNCPRHKNYCNHHPFYFDMEKFHQMSLRYDLANNSMIRENLYFNLYEFPLAGHIDNARYGVWEENPPMLKKSLNNKNIKFICNSIKGWSQNLEDTLFNYYKNPVLEELISTSKQVKIENKEFLVDRIDYNKALKCSQRTHVIIVNLNQIDYTKNLINCLLTQTKDYDLTIFDNGSTEYGTKEYYDYLEKNWPENGYLNIIRNSVNAPLNHVWNWFYEHTNNEFLAFLNNDLEICDNFIDHSERTFDSDSIIGIVLHPTNRKEYTKKDNLDYEIMNEPVLQGWDFIIKRDSYTPIPNELLIYAGDSYLIQQLYLEKNNKQAYCISSPILHYRSKTINENKSLLNNILNKDIKTFRLKYNNYKVSFKDNKYMHREFNGIFPLDLTKKIIVSFTTWKKRIKYADTSISNMLSQTKIPDKIILNISKKEFENNMEIVNPLIEKFKNHPIVEINLVDGENTTVWKKFIPIIENYPNDLIITIDDDIRYPKDYIEKMWKSYIKYPYSPISGISKIWYGYNHCSGAFHLTQFKFLKLFLKEWKQDYRYCLSEDTWYVYMSKLNGYEYKTAIEDMYNSLHKYEIKTDTSYTKTCKPTFTIDTYKYLIKKYWRDSKFREKK